MLESPAYRVLSLSAHRALSRVEVEFAHHGGQDNGKLPVTYDDFERYGVRRRSIGPALLELGVLGFIVITEHGKMAKAAEYRRPNKFLLTSRPKQKGIEVADRWRQFKTTKEAEAAVKAARQMADKARCPERRKEKAASGETAPLPVAKRHRRRKIASGEAAPLGMGETAPLSISRGGHRTQARVATAETPPTTDGQTLATVSALADSGSAPTKASAAPPLPEPIACPAAPKPAALVLMLKYQGRHAAAPATGEFYDTASALTPACEAQTADGMLPLAASPDGPAAPPLAEAPSSTITAEPMIDGVPMIAAVYSITGHHGPVVVVDDSRPIRCVRFANGA